MTAKIRLLNDQTINQIAAGEVIENPASVVKELVENALDAGATEITVEIKGGGRQLIRISDNGCGMSTDDALLCLERHATSKIRSAEEIFEIGTLGFRGEAIPSIASISKFVLLTCPQGAEEGTLIIIDGGIMISRGAAACSPGTTIEVKQLFFNVPVRKKFQRSPTYDTQQIEKICLALALAHPKVSFQLMSNQERVLFTPPLSPQMSHIKALEERIRVLLGEEMYTSLRHVEVEQDGMKLIAFLALPHLHRPNRSGQYFFINGRHVTAPFLSYCVKESYSTLLPSNRHPLFVMVLELPPGTVDANVHPQKREVRFLKEMALQQLVRRSVMEVLQGGGDLPSTSLETEIIEKSLLNNTYDSNYREDNRTWVPPLSTTNHWNDLSPPFHEASPTETESTFTIPMKPLPSLLPQKILPWEEKTSPAPAILPLDSAKSIPPLLTTIEGYLLLEPSAAIGSILLVTHPLTIPALFLVDQRRAHQRILYEKLSSTQASAPEAQTLLFPHQLELSSADSALLQEHKAALNAMGLAIEQVGPSNWNIEAVPACFGPVELTQLFEQLITSLRSYVSHSNLLTNLLAKQLCDAVGRASLSSRTRLDLREGNALLRQLYACMQPSLCPQGQRIAACFSLEEIQRRFF